MKNSLLLVALIAAFSASAQLPAPKSQGYANVNGQKIYYEIYGEGQPVLLLHGAFMTINLNWAQIIPGLSKTRQVIAVEMRGHGHTPLTNGPLTYDAVTDDVAKTLEFLKIDSADVVGYSYGGTIAYNLAIKYPKRVKKLVIISSAYKSEGWQPEVRNALKSLQPAMFDNTPPKAEYEKVAPDKSQWHAFLTAMFELSGKDFNLGDDKIKNIQSPTLLISGDNDGLDKNVLLHTYEQLGGLVFADFKGVPKSQLAIVPGTGHVSLMMDTENILRLLTRFLQ